MEDKNLPLVVKGRRVSVSLRLPGLHNEFGVSPYCTVRLSKFIISKYITQHKVDYFTVFCWFCWSMSFVGAAVF